VNGIAQRRGKPIVRIFDSSCAVKKMTRLLSPGLTNNKEDTADRFQDAIHALNENADREKALHMLSVYFVFTSTL
jgi:hypothetical protein